MTSDIAFLLSGETFFWLDCPAKTICALFYIVIASLSSSCRK
jgi:hypothetical protein